MYSMCVYTCRRCIEDIASGHQLTSQFDRMTISGWNKFHSPFLNRRAAPVQTEDKKKIIIIKLRGVERGEDIVKKKCSAAFQVNANCYSLWCFFCALSWAKKQCKASRTSFLSSTLIDFSVFFTTASEQDEGENVSPYSHSYLLLVLEESFEHAYTKLERKFLSKIVAIMFQKRCNNITKRQMRKLENSLAKAHDLKSRLDGCETI